MQTIDKHSIIEVVKQRKKEDKIVKTFFGSKFMEKEKLEEAGIYHPIKLEYYKMIHEDELINGKHPKFGIKVVKTEYLKEDTKVEEKEIKYISNDEKKVNEILGILKENEVTPVCVQDIICDFSKKMLYL